MKILFPILIFFIFLFSPLKIYAKTIDDLYQELYYLIEQKDTYSTKNNMTKEEIILEKENLEQEIVNLTEVIDSDYMINGSNIKIVSSGVYLVNVQVGTDKFRINNKGVPILKGIKNGTKILYLKKNDILTVQIYNSTNSLDDNYTSFIDVIKLS